MEIDFFEEPELEFGISQHVDIRFGLMNFGPVDFDTTRAPKEIKLGIVGSNESVEGVQRWLERCRDGIPAKESKQPNLFPRFPGFRPDVSFHSSLVTGADLIRTIKPGEFRALWGEHDRKEAFELAAKLFHDEMEYLKEKHKPHVLVCAIPQELFDITEPPDDTGTEEESKGDDSTDAEDGEYPPRRQTDFHDLLKARAMDLDIPIQLIIPSTYDEKKLRRQKRDRASLRRIQDEATRAWNIHTALYYKAQGTPWRLLRGLSDYATCYVGISFYKTLDGAALLTSVAQVFNERGNGVVVRGGYATISKDDRQVHIAGDDAEALLERALKLYKKEHMNFPARIVVHKSSTYLPDELEGFQAAAKKCGVELMDFVSMSKPFTRLFRAGKYPPLRGTFLSLDERNHILYTRGSVDFFSTYPGMYVPRSLLFRCEHTEQTPRFLGKEILALTKMNWNNTQFDGGKPITMRAAEQVGSILKYIASDGYVASSYRFYM